MFDRIMAVCPECHDEVEFQSKAGVCDLKRYHHTSVPANIAMDINLDEEKCDNCGTWITLKAEAPRVNVAVMRGRASLDEEDGDGYD